MAKFFGGHHLNARIRKNFKVWSGYYSSSDIGLSFFLLPLYNSKPISVCYIYQNLSSFAIYAPAIEKTCKYVWTITTHPRDKTLNPWRQVRLLLDAGSVLMILLPFDIGLKARRQLTNIPKMQKKNGNYYSRNLE